MDGWMDGWILGLFCLALVCEVRGLGIRGLLGCYGGFVVAVLGLLGLAWLGLAWL
ncbi:hypothetical protein P280DRAFT_470556 [Massarina eburnea CBS 473.64]|uniref:Uncharacterized protein n=1 Tax=Massarina eburnea CBS 473.64 TaxID=1395130 RepID=A0A6A6RUC9_9PLEO|nr:hypothetical protein P280DRAFT_470556 [Massarina eburnea CBS 473.64]